MTSLTFHMNKSWPKLRVVSYSSFYCPNCLRTFIPSTGSSNKNNRNTHFKSLHTSSFRKPVRCQTNVVKNNLFQNNYAYSIGHNSSTSIQKSSFHTLFQTYRNIFAYISESAPVVSTQNFLVNIHDSSGLPWWATIVVATVLFRSAITLPLALYQQYILAKVENLRLELPDIAKELQKEVEVAAHMYKWSPLMASFAYRRSLKKQWTLLVERDNCHPAKAGIVVLFQFPVWILYSMSIRNLVSKRPFFDEAAEQVFSQMQNEGFLWISNLTVPDGTMIIPFMLWFVSLSIIEVNRLMHIQEMTRFRKILTNIFRCCTIIPLVFGYIVPSCLSFYWFTSATVGLCQNLIVMSPRLKLLVGVPRTPTTLSNPYRHLWNQFRIDWKLSGSSQK